MLQMAHALGAPVLLVAASTNAVAAQDLDSLARDLRKLAMLAVPLGLKVAYEGHRGAKVIKDHFAAWEAVCLADMLNLGVAIDTAHAVAHQTSLEDLDLIESYKIFVLRLADVMHPGAPGEAADPAGAGPFRVFPGEGPNSQAVAALVRRLDELGFRGDYSFEVCNKDYQQLPPPLVAGRAWAACEWLGEDVLRRSVPLPGRMRLRQVAPS
jgi:sugar phosphate isomerase/epimerase